MKTRLLEALSIQKWVENNFIGRGMLDPLEDWQKEFFTYANDYDKPILVNACRGSGKTELAALIACHTVIFRNDMTVLLVAPNGHQAKETYRRCRKAYDRYKSPFKPYPITDSKSSMELSNGSRVVVISGGNEIAPRSFRSNLVIADELAFCDRVMVETALLPSMSGVPNAKVIFISTPNGRDNIFFEYWESPPETFNKMFVPADKSNRVKEKDLARARATTRPERFRQEYFCEFIAGGEHPYFNADVIARCFVDMEDQFEGFF